MQNSINSKPDIELTSSVILESATGNGKGNSNSNDKLKGNIKLQVWPQVRFWFQYLTLSMLGVFTREAITSLSNYENSYVQAGSVLWSNFTACLIMGLLQEMNSANWFVNHPELFTSLTTGYCGSLSSYSTMMLETFEHSASLTRPNITHHTKLPNRAYGIMEFLSVIIVQMFVSMDSLLFGRYLSREVIICHFNGKKDDDDEIETNSSIEPSSFISRTITYLNYVTWIMAIPLIALIVTLAGVYGNYSRGKWTLPTLFGIFGSFGRYYISKLLNPRLANFPIGTFTVNQFAVIFITVLELVQRGKKHSNGNIPIINTVNACHVTAALSTGFCGGLSTVSTFINEGYKMKFIHLLRYFVSSISVSYAICVIILGSYSWSVGLTVPVC
ncbi:hypothetical protein Kpol_1036p10 [Vanderwaltozyma polyspora DSM 70294]|uniref:Uncharacterized protein n=1 Tax=Vanderwaltozyma polyspora (strain ATCC 22028 / DSM 70294 / BCRC 21397 / CBS 2163 / NBRC 10782 / NRRL Y-8283 / UCD 57-17) TaxID=436907 RepID=A7TEG1_VANPO|nr:uncharacterized protein Kpol_1036p10 [Vanderwaltozyma polyspora DSM 70294]EDO19268.1 hypothetical protein Kpol_1036p10 [Vanderwaltozyma polyspora DSM 70294]